MFASKEDPDYKKLLALVEDAKRLLMNRYGIDEPEAHRRMQQYAMRHNMKMTDYAMQLLQGGPNDG